VVVTSLRDNTFFARMKMRMSDGNRMDLDSKTLDAIALALGRLSDLVDEEVIGVPETARRKRRAGKIVGSGEERVARCNWRGW